MKRLLLSSVALLAVAAIALTPAAAAPDIARYLGDAPQTFDDDKAALEMLKSGLVAKDVAGLAKLIGLDPEQMASSEGFDERLSELQEAAKERLQIVDDGTDRRVVLVGDLIWPFPFPLVKTGDKWAFDTEAGLEEILDRRIGENELETIQTLRNYVTAQNIYGAEDWDGDGVMEFAQMLKSPEGTRDGLYWPASADGWESPAGPFVDESRADQTADNGYFGYRYRILTGQGDNVAGGNYAYVINGNMIGGHAMIAWPARYGETGIKTFLVSHHGQIYERDFGSATEHEAGAINQFNPDRDWQRLEE